MALPTHQVKLSILFLDGTPISTARPIFTVLFGKGKWILQLVLSQVMNLLISFQSIIFMSQGKRLLSKDMYGLSTVLSMVALRKLLQSLGSFSGGLQFSIQKFKVSSYASLAFLWPSCCSSQGWQMFLAWKFSQLDTRSSHTFTFWIFSMNRSHNFYWAEIWQIWPNLNRLKILNRENSLKSTLSD